MGRPAHVLNRSCPVISDLVGGAHSKHHLPMPISENTKVIKRLGLKDTTGLKQHGSNAVVGPKVAIECGGSGHSKHGNLMLNEWIHFASIQRSRLQAGSSDEDLPSPASGQCLDAFSLVLGRDNASAAQCVLLRPTPRCEAPRSFAVLPVCPLYPGCSVSQRSSTSLVGE